MGEMQGLKLLTNNQVDFIKFIKFRKIHKLINEPRIKANTSRVQRMQELFHHLEKKNDS